MVFVGMLAFGLATAALAQTSAIEVDQVWARATPPGAKTGAVYLTLVNKGDTEDRLVSVATPVAGKAELHTTINDNGIMRMRPIAAVAVKPGSSTKLQPSGMHIMLTELKAPLVAGQSFTLTLTFEKAGSREVTATVGKAGSMGMPGMPGMKM
jgi:copper(I)-binding protein